MSEKVLQELIIQEPDLPGLDIVNGVDEHHIVPGHSFLGFGGVQELLHGMPDIGFNAGCINASAGWSPSRYSNAGRTFSIGTLIGH